MEKGVRWLSWFVGSAANAEVMDTIPDLDKR